ncbi:hypothetical protein BVY00_02425 [bacterium G20]|nr:hypothetical protein BVY00_02425 [bacterium G20]
MAYKNIEDRKAASKRHYYANKLKYLERNQKYRKYIKDLVRDIKEKTPCADCGVNYPYYVMDFDHLENQEKSNIISFFAQTGRVGALKLELAKCEVVCSNCHRARTHKRLE